MRNKPTKLERVELSLQEIWQATRPLVQRNRKKYRRNKKHKYQDE